MTALFLLALSGLALFFLAGSKAKEAQAEYERNTALDGHEVI